MKTSWTNGDVIYRFSTMDDLPSFVAMLQDPAVGSFLWFTPIDQQGVEGFFRPMLEAQAETLELEAAPASAVFSVLDAGQNFLGQGAVVEVMGSPGGYEIGYQLTRAAWGRGVGTQLSLFLCAYALLKLDAYRLEGSCMEQNIASKRLFEKLGFDLEGTKPGFRLKGETRHNELFFGKETARLDKGPILELATTVGLLP